MSSSPQRKGMAFENDKPIFFFKCEWTTDGQVAYWNWRVFTGEVSYAKALGERVEGDTAIVYVQNPQDIHPAFVNKIIAMSLKNHELMPKD